MKTRRGSDVINAAFENSSIAGQLLSYEKQLNGKILVDEAELRERLKTEHRVKWDLDINLGY